MRKALGLAILCGIFLAVVLSCASTGGSSAVLPPVPATGEWMTYNDRGSDGGSSISNMTIVEEEIDGKKVTVYQVTGNVTTQFEYGFAGWGLDADAATMELYKNARALSFYFLGDGKRYTIKFKTSAIEDYCYHEYTFNTTAGVAEYIEVPMGYFMQPAWGVPKRFNPALVTGVEWQTHESWRLDPRNNPFSIKMWDFMIHPASGKAPAKAATAAPAAAAGLQMPLEVPLRDNFQYSNTYAGDIRDPAFMNGGRFMTGDSYTLKVTYTVSRDLENPIWVGLVDQTPGANYWNSLSWIQRTTEASPLTLGATPKAGQTYTAEVVFTVARNASGGAAAANTLRFESVGSRGKPAPVITFTSFSFTKN